MKYKLNNRRVIKTNRIYTVTCLSSRSCLQFFTCMDRKILQMVTLGLYMECRYVVEIKFDHKGDVCTIYDYSDYIYLERLDWEDKHKINWLCRLLDYIRGKR